MTGNLIISASLGDFFKQEVTKASQVLRLQIPGAVQTYLVDLLVDYSNSDANALPGDEPLAMMYKRSLEVDRVERIRLLRDLGDMALYSAGFFAEWIAQKPVDISYYVSMGGGAYGTLSDLVRKHDGSESDVFLSLAKDFSNYVGLLGEISERSRGQADQDLVRMYDRWLQTGNERLKRILLEKGLVGEESGAALD